MASLAWQAAGWIDRPRDAGKWASSSPGGVAILLNISAVGTNLEVEGADVDPRLSASFRRAGLVEFNPRNKRPRNEAKMLGLPEQG